MPVAAPQFTLFVVGQWASTLTSRRGSATYDVAGLATRQQLVFQILQLFKGLIAAQYNADCCLAAGYIVSIEDI